MATPNIGVHGSTYDIEAQLPLGGKAKLQFTDSASSSELTVRPLGKGFVLGGLMYVSTSSSVLSDSATETSVVGSGVGSKAISANTLAVGSCFHLKADGKISTSGDAPDVTWKVKYGSTTLSTSGSFSIPTWTDAGVTLEAAIVVRSLGATGTASITGEIRYRPSCGGATLGCRLPPGIITIDTTNSFDLDITATWSAADAANVLTIPNVIFNRMQ